MKLIYKLSEELESDPGYVNTVQALSLDDSRPYLGLKGVHGLFGSPEWWGNIENGVLPTIRYSGVITRLYFSGQDSLGKPNTFDFIDGNGFLRTESFYANRKKDHALYKIGHFVDILYALDELKFDDGKNKYSENVLEVAVSLHSVSLANSLE